MSIEVIGKIIRKTFRFLIKMFSNPTVYIALILLIPIYGVWCGISFAWDLLDGLWEED